MKILLYGINFAPEPTGVGKYSGEMAVWLAAAGHQVRVVTAPPYYPAWKVGHGYRSWRHVRESSQGIGIWRTPVWVPARPSGLTRLIHLCSFAFCSIPTLIRQIFWSPDVICVVVPTFVCAPAGWLAARLSRAKLWMHIQDFEVDAAFRMGLLKGSTGQRVVLAVERWLLRRFDRVSTISNRMLDLLNSKGVVGERAVLFPNWVDINSIVPLKRPSTYRAELGIADDAIVALFSGSMAAKQGLEMIPEAARLAVDALPNTYFVLCGDGVCRPELEKLSEGLANMRLLPLQPSERLGELLNLADIHLLPQHADAADLVMPSKLTGMLSSGRPVLSTANVGTELERVVKECGIVVPPNSLPLFMEALTTLVRSPALREKYGSAARRYAEDNLARDRVLAAFESALFECVEKAGARRKAALNLP